jgi:hypothetical protein
MGLTKFIEKLIAGDPEERKFRKEINAEAKQKENEVFHNNYRTEKMRVAEEKGKAKARRIAENNAKGNGGFLDSLAKIGDGMNKASKGLVEGIDIDPSGGESEDED